MDTYYTVTSGQNPDGVNLSRVPASQIIPLIQAYLEDDLLPLCDNSDDAKALIIQYNHMAVIDKIIHDPDLASPPHITAMIRGQWVTWELYARDYTGLDTAKARQLWHAIDEHSWRHSCLTEWRKWLLHSSHHSREVLAIARAGLALYDTH